MGLAPAKGTRPRAEVGRAVEMRQGWPDKAAGEGEAEGRSRGGFRNWTRRLNFGDRAARRKFRIHQGPQGHPLQEIVYFFFSRAPPQI